MVVMEEVLSISPLIPSLSREVCNQTELMEKTTSVAPTVVVVEEEPEAQ